VTTPEPPSMLKPFDEAVSSVRERIPQTPEFYRALDNDARLRALSVAGGDLYVSMKQELALAIEKAATASAADEA
jgi:hypothetical protein